MDGKDTRERCTPPVEAEDLNAKYAPIVADAALWLFRKYYGIRSFMTFEPGHPYKPNPLSRMGASEAGDIEAELWIFALRTGLFEEVERRPESGQERYLRRCLHNVIRRAVKLGMDRKAILDDSVDADVQARKVARHEARLNALATLEEADGIGDACEVLAGDLDMSLTDAELALESLRYDTGTSVSPTSYYWRGVSPEMNEGVKAAHYEDELSKWM